MPEINASETYLRWLETFGCLYIDDDDFGGESHQVSVVEELLSEYSSDLNSRLPEFFFEAHVTNGEAFSAKVALRSERYFFVAIGAGVVRALRSAARAIVAAQDASLDADLVFRATIDFIVIHEFAHIKNGHLPFLRKFGRPEIQEDALGSVPQKVRHALETDADMVAAKYVMERVLHLRYLGLGSGVPLYEANFDPERYLFETRAENFGAAIGAVFYLSETEGASGDEPQLTHPTPSIRFHSTVALAETILGFVRNLDAEKMAKTLRAIATGAVKVRQILGEVSGYRYRRSTDGEEIARALASVMLGQEPFTYSTMALSTEAEATIGDAYTTSFTAVWASIVSELSPLAIGDRLAPAIPYSVDTVSSTVPTV